MNNTIPFQLKLNIALSIKICEKQGHILKIEVLQFTLVNLQNIRRDKKEFNQDNFKLFNNR